MDKYQCLKLISCQVFSPNCQKLTWGHHRGCLMPPQCPPCYFFLRTKIIFPIKCTAFFSKNKNNIGGGHQGASDTTQPSSTTHNISHQHITHPKTHPPNPTPTPLPQPTPPPPHHHPPPTHREKWGLNA